MTAPAAHPDDAVLAAFGNGRLSGHSVETVANHLDTCADCRKRVAELSADSLLGRLRDARPAGGTPPPDGGLTGVPAPPAPVPAGVPPELVATGEYTHVAELGRGGMGVVYKAHNAFMDRAEVLKVMSREVVARPGAVERFKREVQSAARLDHPNVVKAYSARPFGDLLVFAMEFVPGRDLAVLVKERGPLPVAHAAFYAQQVAAGLQHAFEKGMVHRDIKPQNLILRQDGKKHTVKVLDFGLAKVTSEAGFDAGLTGEGKMLGTPDYIAPEQILDAQSADIRADVYSLGCTLYFLLTGGPPFRANSLYELLRQHREEDARPVNFVRPQVPEELAGVVSRMMAKDPARRFPTPAEVVRALAPFTKPGTAPAAAKPVRVAAPPVLPAASGGAELVSVSLVAGPAAGPAAAPAATPTQWETMTATTPPAPTPAPVEADPPPSVRQRAPRRRVPAWGWAVAAVAGAVVVAGVLAAGGAFRVRTAEGTIVLENLPADADVLVDGERVTVSRKGDEAVVTAVKGGPHRLKVVQGGRDVYSSDLTLKVGGEPLRVRVERGPPPPPIPDPGTNPPLLPDLRPSPDARYAALFNGKDLTGWKAGPAPFTEWVVADGKLATRRRGNAPHQMPGAHLYYDASEYTRFQLKVKCRMATAGNSGIFVRLPQAASTNKGYEIDMMATGSVMYGLGDILYDGKLVRKAQSPPINQGDWFELDILSAGRELAVSVNGVVVNRIQDAVPPAGGHIALSTAVANPVVEFDSIAICPLPAAAPGPIIPPSPPAPNPTFVPLFNGKDLSGWEHGPGHKGRDWAVNAKGELTSAGVQSTAGGAAELVTKRKDYYNFRLKLQVQNNDGQAKQIYIRSSYGIGYGGPQRAVGGAIPVGSISKYAAQPPQGMVAQASGVSPKVGEWYTLEIVAVGNRITTLVNGVTVADYTDPDTTIRPSEISLVCRSATECYFKAIEIAELPADGPRPAAAPGPIIPPSPPAPNPTFVPLFNGKDLSGWKTGKGKQSWFINRGALVNTSGGTLLSEKSYTDFTMKFDFQVTPDTAASVDIWAIPGDTPLWVFLDNTRDAMGAITFDGREKGIAVRRLTPRAELRAATEWNEMTIEVRDAVLSVTLNGRVLDRTSIREHFEARRQALPAGSRLQGQIGLTKRSGQGTVRIRNVAVLEP